MFSLEPKSFVFFEIRQSFQQEDSANKEKNHAVPASLPVP
jgi:hypothetical protein